VNFRNSEGGRIGHDSFTVDYDLAFKALLFAMTIGRIYSIGNVRREVFLKFIGALLLPAFLSPTLLSNTKLGPQTLDMAMRDPAILTHLAENYGRGYL
jgi:hypothetical protein